MPVDKTIDDNDDDIHCPVCNGVMTMDMEQSKDYDDSNFIDAWVCKQPGCTGVVFAGPGYYEQRMRQQELRKAPKYWCSQCKKLQPFLNLPHSEEYKCCGVCRHQVYWEFLSDKQRRNRRKAKQTQAS